MKAGATRAGTRSSGRPSGARRPGARTAATDGGRSGAPRPQDPGRGRLSRRTLAVLGAACLAVVALTVAAVTALGHQRGDEVASLDGHPVTRDELIFHMKRLAPTVQNELRTTYHLQGTFTWSAMTGKRTALQRLEDRAFDEVREDRTTLLLAEEQGLIDSADFADLEAERTKENASRAQDIAAGRTVYGVSQFSPEEYYGHRLTELTTGLKTRLAKTPGDPLHVTDAEVRKAFDADQDAWSANATTYRYSRLVVQVPKNASAAHVSALQRRVQAAGRLSAVSGEPDAELTTGTYDGSGSTGLNTHDQDLMSVLGELEPGRISPPVTGTGQLTFYQLDSKKTDEDKAFKEYAQRIRQSLVDKKFTAFLQRRADDASLDVDASAVAAINTKDVQQ